MTPGSPVDLEARHVGITYPRRPVAAVTDISFEVPAGHCLLIAGPSGSGKSTLARAIAGLVPWSVPARVDGRLLVGDLVVGGDGSGPAVSSGAPGARTGTNLATSAPAGGNLAPPGAIAGIGVVFQDPAAQLVMERVADDVAFGLEGRAWPRASMLARVPAALAEAGLAGFDRRRTAHLSGGEQQRLALAGALAPLPGLLVLDEPTANLDPTGALEFAARLRALRAGRTTTIVLVEHRAELAWAIADFVLALDPAGRTLAFGPVDEVLATRRRELEAAGIWLPDEATPGPEEPLAAIDESAAAPGGPADGSLLELRDVGFAWERGGRPIVAWASLALRAGERVALVGTNGSGKSTLARLAVGLLRPATGTVRLAGRDPALMRPAELARLAGYVVQDPERSFLAATVEGELLAGLTPAEAAAAGDVAEALRLPLATFGARSPFTLSGGEQRRLSVAAQLVRRPRLLVLDEPTFGQDRRGYEGLLAILRDQVADGTAVLSVTHDLRFVAAMADRILEMIGGAPADVPAQSAPASPSAAPASRSGSPPAPPVAPPSPSAAPASRSGSPLGPADAFAAP